MEETHDEKVRRSVTASPSATGPPVPHPHPGVHPRPDRRRSSSSGPEWVIPEDEAWGRDDANAAAARNPSTSSDSGRATCGRTTPGSTSTPWRPSARSGGCDPPTRGGHEVSQTHDHTRPARRDPGVRARSASSRSWRRRSANWRSRRACSRWRTTGASPSGPNRSARPADRSWSPRPGPTRSSRSGCSPTAPRPARRWASTGSIPPVSAHPSDYTYFYVLENTPDGAQRDRLHAVLVLSAAGARHVAGLVPDAELPAPPGALAA